MGFVGGGWIVYGDDVHSLVDFDKARIYCHVWIKLSPIWLPDARPSSMGIVRRLWIDHVMDDQYALEGF